MLNRKNVKSLQIGKKSPNLPVSIVPRPGTSSVLSLPSESRIASRELISGSSWTYRMTRNTAIVAQTRNRRAAARITMLNIFVVILVFNVQRSLDVFAPIDNFHRCHVGQRTVRFVALDRTRIQAVTFVVRITDSRIGCLVGIIVRTMPK